MSRYERYATRSLVYSKWHRFYLGDNEPMIDLDGIEYCPECNKSLALIETARDVGQGWKPTSVLYAHAESAQTLALCVLYSVSEDTDEQSGCDCQPDKVIDGCDHGISSFRVRRVWPRPKSRAWNRMSPEEFGDRLRLVRMNHLDAEHRLWNGDGS